MDMRILAVGDVVGESGLSWLEDSLRPLQRLKGIGFTVVNGENAAGLGLLPRHADELFDAGVDVVLDLGQASASMLQRRLKLGYSRAARLVDQMEERGIVGPFEGSKPRQLLITREQWQEMQMGGAAPEEAPPAEEG